MIIEHNEILLDIDKSVLFQMIRMVNFFAHNYDDSVPAELNLSRREYHILLVIAVHPGVSAIEICDYSGYSQMAISRGTKNLLKYGRIIKKQDNKDKRKFELYLTQSGWDLYKTICPVSLHLEREAISCLSKKQANSLNEIMGILNNRLTLEPIRLDISRDD